ncbi:hypothetical protein EWM64_g2788 [Hericium alpestre]|uniref:NADH dehydrogenase [ubiquinone] 1 beta subcomplex subunit 8, mitochondrial n=1 Tax=Hericium alpestre TaxID=135208 RepID=A0A4Z0A467_9AGAM|nr:hypothetical protein EWM64_g2788 [Hericium alpestre]
MSALQRVAARAALKPKHLTLSRRGYAAPTAHEEPDPQLHGYPQLPDVSRQTLPPKGWWDWQMRRNFGDVMHERDELYSMWGPDVAPIPPATALRQFTIAALGFVGFGFLVKYALVPERPCVPREYPFDGLVAELGGLEENKVRAIFQRLRDFF